jgi:hypothetical protein
MASARSARVVNLAFCRSSSAIFLPRGSTARAFGPRFFVAAPEASRPGSVPLATSPAATSTDLAPEQSPNFARRLAGVGLLHDPTFVLDGERPSLGLFGHLGVLAEGRYRGRGHDGILARPAL